MVHAQAAPGVAGPKEFTIYFQSGNTVGPNQTVYIYCMQLYPPEGYDSVETNTGVRFLATRAGTLKNLYVHVNTPPGLGETFTFRLRINGVNTALTCTISGAAAYDASDTAHTAAVAVGDRITLAFTASALAAWSAPEGAVEFDS